MKKKLVSIVVSAYNEEGNVLELYNRLVENMKKCKAVDYEILFVNDGSGDQTLPRLRTIASKDHVVRSR